MEQEHANDNEDPFISLAAATARLFEEANPYREKKPAKDHWRGEGEKRKAERSKFKIG